MKTGMYYLTRDVTVEECDWLPRDFLEDEIVFAFYGATYGCISPGGVPVSEVDGVAPFLEMPINALQEMEI